MADNLFSSPVSTRETVCIDTYRVLDSCRDRDCFKNTKCFLTPCGQDIIDRTETVRAKCAKILSAHTDLNEVPFNNGFYQLNIKMFVKLVCEACVCLGNIQEFDALCVLDKKVVLYGGEGSVSVFKSQCGCTTFCPTPDSEMCEAGDTMPISVIETIDPIVLELKVKEKGHTCKCSCTERDVPAGIVKNMGGNLVHSEDGRSLVATLGLFSVVRIERPAQLLINASDYSVPEKQCIEACDDDPCSIFSGIPFPEKEFNPSQCKPVGRNTRCGCTG